MNSTATGMTGQAPVSSAHAERLRRLLRDYDADRGEPRDVRMSAGALAARLAFPGGASWTVRACRAGQALPDQLTGCAEPDMGSWARSRMRTLRFLADAGYPAPRVILTRHGELTASVAGWCVRVVTHVDGTVIGPSRRQLGLLGAALGRLHTVTPAPEAGRSYWHPQAAIPATLRLLAATAPLVPACWQALHATLRHAAEGMRDAAPALPGSVIHGDVWAANCVQTAPGQVTLIDWDTAGLGPAVLDLGRALLECHLDSGLPADDQGAWLISPDERRITALADGYRSARALSAAELRLLPEAIRFGVAFVGAIHARQALVRGLAGPGMDARLARLRNRLDVSQQVADVAVRAFSR